MTSNSCDAGTQPPFEDIWTGYALSKLSSPHCGVDAPASPVGIVDLGWNLFSEGWGFGVMRGTILWHQKLKHPARIRLMHIWHEKYHCDFAFGNRKLNNESYRWPACGCSSPWLIAKAPGALSHRGQTGCPRQQLDLKFRAANQTSAGNLFCAKGPTAGSDIVCLEEGADPFSGAPPTALRARGGGGG